MQLGCCARARDGGARPGRTCSAAGAPVEGVELWDSRQQVLVFLATSPTNLAKDWPDTFFPSPSIIHSFLFEVSEFSESGHCLFLTVQYASAV